tara:strand:+ start:325 stop:495 length:171 start_codon:yes stop_codon:yes gene_type:complete
MSVPKPAKDVWKRMFAGNATPEDKEATQAYLADRRAVKLGERIAGWLLLPPNGRTT